MDSSERALDDAGKNAQGTAEPGRATPRAAPDPRLRATLYLDQWDRNQAELARTGPTLPRRFRL